MLYLLASVDSLCSTTCRSERAGDEEHPWCNEKWGLDVPVSCVCHELQMDCSSEVSRCTISGLRHAGPKKA